MKGRVIGQYRVTGVLGEGGMGVVYAAEHTLLDRPAAVKVLRPDFSRKQEIVTRFFNEARAATAIRHFGIVEIYDFGWTDDGSAFIVMEHLQGETLRARRRRAAMPWSTALALVRQIAGALGAAHAKGIVHRDLKPDNIFLVPDQEVPGGERIKLLDFGIARLTGVVSSGHKTKTGTVMGTPAYMAPEQCRGVAVDARADLYALGCILFLLCTGRPPFISGSKGDILAAHISEPPPALSSLASGVPDELESLVRRMLAKAPADRVQTAGELIQLIDTARASIDQVARSGSHPVLAPARSLPDVPASTAHDEPDAREVAPTLLEHSSTSRTRRDVVATTLPAHEEGAATTMTAVRAVRPAAPAAPILDTTISSAAGMQADTTFAPAATHSPGRRRMILAGVGGVAILGAIALMFALLPGGGDDAPRKVAAAAPNAASSLLAEELRLPDEAAPSPPPVAPDAPPAPTPPAPPEPGSSAPSSEPPGAPSAKEPSPAPPNGSSASATPPAAPARRSNTRSAEAPQRASTATVRITIDSTPRGATLMRDDEVLGETPWVGNVPRGDANVRFVLRIAGHQPRVLLIRPNKASVHNASLEKLLPSPPSEAPAP